MAQGDEEGLQGTQHLPALILRLHKRPDDIGIDALDLVPPVCAHGLGLFLIRYGYIE